MVSRISQVPDRNNCPQGFSSRPERTQESYSLHSTKSLSLGLKKRAWHQILQALRLPHFSHSKRLGLIHENRIPVIYSKHFLVPVLQTSSVEEIQTPSSDQHQKRIAVHQCSSCLEEDLRYDRKEDVMKCIHCGHTEMYVASENYVRSSRKIFIARKYSPSCYKRLVHFKFWIKRLQGKEQNKVTASMIQEIKDLMIKDNYQGVHYWNTRNAMKRLGYSSYYDNTIYIMSRIRGTPLVQLTKKQESILIQMFLDIQPAFLQVSQGRANMLSYPYIIKKICEIKKWFNMARVIPTLKSHLRIHIQDELWKKVCILTNWKFIPTERWTLLETRAPNCRAL